MAKGNKEPLVVTIKIPSKCFKWFLIFLFGLIVVMMLGKSNLVILLGEYIKAKF